MAIPLSCKKIMAINVVAYKTLLDEERYPYIAEAGKYRVNGERPCLRNPRSIADFMANDVGLVYEAVENFWALAFDTKNRLTAMFLISTGTVNASLVSPRDVYQKLLMLGAVYWVGVHNHPSGEVEPSNSDTQMTKKLEQGGDILNIPMMDHIIVGDHGKYASFRENGLMEVRA